MFIMTIIIIIIIIFFSCLGSNKLSWAHTSAIRVVCSEQLYNPTVSGPCKLISAWGSGCHVEVQ